MYPQETSQREYQCKTSEYAQDIVPHEIIEVLDRWMRNEERDDPEYAAYLGVLNNFDAALGAFHSALNGDIATARQRNSEMRASASPLELPEAGPMPLTAKERAAEVKSERRLVSWGA